MAEQTEFSSAGSAPGPQLAVSEEDAGRLDGASRWRLTAVIVALVLFAEAITFQQSMISNIVPKLAASFPQVGANVTWSITILGVAGGATMALVGKLGDLIGKKRVLLICGVLFAVGSLICAVTATWGVFLAGRALCGISLGLSAAEYGIVRDLMPRRWIPVTVGIIGTGLGFSAILGPIIAGWLTDAFSWRSVFWFLLIYIVAIMPVFMLAVPETPLRARQRFDLLGAVLFGTGVGASLVYLSEGSSWGWGSITCLAYLIGGLALLAAFVAWEARVPEPMMELSLLRTPRVLIVMLNALLLTAVISMTYIAIAYMFETPKEAQLKQQILAGAAAQSHQPLSVITALVHFQGDLSYATAGFSVLALALHITLWTAAFGLVGGPLGGYLARRIGGRLPLLLSCALLLAACALWVPWHKTWQEQVAIGVLWGLGFGFYFGSNPNLLIDAVPASRQGVSGGMNAVFGSIGSSIGIALFTALVAAHPLKLAVTVAGHTVTSTVPGVYTDTGYVLSYIVVGIVPAAIALILTLFLRSGRTPARGGAAAPVTDAPVTEAAGGGR
jgi:MFS family permease